MSKKNKAGLFSEKKNKTMLVVAISVVFLLLVAGIVESGSLSKLMGNSVTQYYCEDGYDLKGDKCVKKVSQNPYKIGDVNQDGIININDVTVIQRYLAEFVTLDDYQTLLADVNQDGKVDIVDATILQKYLNESFSGTMSAEHHIGDVTCPRSYVGSGNKCYGEIVVNAMTRTREVDYQMGDKVSYKGMDFYVIEDTDESAEYVNLLKAEPLTAEEVMKFEKDYLNSGVKFFASDSCNADNPSNCTNYYEASTIKKVIDAWANRYFDEGDLSVTDGPRLLDWNIVSQLTKNENEQIGENSYQVHTKVLYSWLIADEDYWVLNFPAGTNTYFAGIVDKTGELSNRNVDAYNSVRPVVTLKKSAVGKEKEAVDYVAGSKVKYNKRSYYVLNDSLKSDDTVTLISLKPLTRAQLVSLSQGMNLEIIGFEYNNFGGVSFGNDTSFENSNVKKIVDVWAKNVANSSDLVQDSTGYSVRVLSYDNDLKEKVIFDKNTGDLGKINLSWLNYECWTMTPSTFGQEYNYMVIKGNDSVSNLSAASSMPVWPVITVKKNTIK